MSYEQVIWKDETGTVLERPVKLIGGVKYNVNINAPPDCFVKITSVEHEWFDAFDGQIYWDDVHAGFSNEFAFVAEASFECPEPGFGFEFGLIIVRYQIQCGEDIINYVNMVSYRK